MSQNIFDATFEPNNDVNVNAFDWSHANNLSTQIGRITPIFCDVVPAKSSFRVNPNFGLQFMPMVFPIQTRLKARISFFRYPLRALWKDYKDFVGNFREGLEEPYIDFNTAKKLKAMASTGSLGDYLGLPTTFVGSFGREKLLNDYFNGQSSPLSYYTNSESFRPSSPGMSKAPIPPILPKPMENNLIPCVSYSFDNYYYFLEDSEHTFDLSFLVPCNSEEEAQGLIKYLAKPYFLLLNSDDYVLERVTSPISEYQITGSGTSFNVKFSIRFTFKSPERGFSAFKFVVVFEDSFVNKFPLLEQPFDDFLLLEECRYTEGSSNQKELTLSTCPWYNSTSEKKDHQQKILAYGFRAYEGVYNSYFRDNRNNPYYLNGQVQYNKFIPSDDGGSDDNLYELRYANWEKDFLTTAVQSPQQGNSPLVGLTTYVQSVTDEKGVKTELLKTSLVDEDGKKYGLSFKSDKDGLVGVDYVELDNGTEVRQARSLYDLATSGISIPDLRMVNCYQKFLELNMRKGYSYKDIIEGRFDVKVRYADLLLPEFFGGVSRDIDVNAVTQTVDQNVGKDSGYAGALGSQSGLAGVRGSANANIECFCDEESIILGLLVVTPLPVYTQLLPKHFTYRGLLEHYQPEFNLIGFQPIKYNEVCPIQAFNDNSKSLMDTFGYQRPWYEYVQKYDSAHGLFRTDLSNFLMHRVFDKKPELARSFLTIDPEQVTDVFAVTETTDKIYGQIWLDITAKLPIARVAIPRLD